MKIILDGDLFFPLRFYDSNSPIQKEQFRINDVLWAKMLSWQREYTMYTPMNHNELLKYLDKVKVLDDEGVKLLMEITNSISGYENTITFYYFSICQGEFLKTIHVTPTQK